MARERLDASLQSGSDANQLHEAARGAVAPHVESQLTQPADVRAAHQFFQPTAEPASVNGVSVLGDRVGFKALAPPGAEGAALTAVPPGGSETMSPLIQMMMKLPGLDFMNSIFEFLSSLFSPDGINNLLSGLDPAALREHAQDALALVSDSAKEHMALDPSLLPDDAPIFQGETGLRELPGAAHPGETTGSMANPDRQLLPDIDRSALNVSGPGDFFKNPFEQAAYADSAQEAGYGQSPELIASGGGDVYSPTLGASGSQAPVSQHQSPPTNALQDASRGKLLQHHHRPAHEALAQAKGKDFVSDFREYTVRSGDNLWDIAERHYGDGSRWPAIYECNKEIIGDNPSLIYPDVKLKLPDASAVADGGPYIVKPGDNLWDIARHHYGDGTEWGKIYEANADVIGDNPRLIHPGQELNLPGHEHSGAAFHHHAPSHHHAAPHHGGQPHGSESVAHKAPANPAQAGGLKADSLKLDLPARTQPVIDQAASNPALAPSAPPAVPQTPVETQVDSATSVPNDASTPEKPVEPPVTVPPVGG